MDSAPCVACGNPSTLRCPECKALQFSDSVSSFCGQVCFKANWKTHKKIHVAPMTYKVIGHSFSPENGLQMVTREPLGRIVLASKSFAIGDCVICEVPLVRYGGVFDLVRQYLLMNEVDKKRIFDMQNYASPNEAHYKESKAHMQEMLDMANTILSHQTTDSGSLGQYIDVHTLFRLLTVSSLNSHDFPDTNTEEISSRITSTGAVGLDSALFPMASKVAHSCDPNCVYTNYHVLNHLFYFAVKPIAPDDMITFSYVGYASTQARRLQLMKTKDFFCLCEKCSDKDYAYGFKCNKPNCTGIKLCICNSADFKTNWCCQVCSDSLPPNLNLISNLETRLQTLKDNYIIDEVRVYSESMVAKLNSLLNESLSSLSATHAFVTEILIELARLHAAGTKTQSHSGKQSKLQLHQQVAQYGIRAIKTMECVDAKCSLGVSCTQHHSASAHCIDLVLMVVTHLLQCNQELPIWIREYVPLLVGLYGAHDVIVKKIRKWFG